MIDLTEELPQKIESMLFSSGRKMNVEELSRLCRATQDQVQVALQELKAKYDESQGSLMLVSESDSWKLTVREKFLPLVQKIVTQTELPKSVIETLAVIAFKHPILQSDLVKIRTNKAYEHLAQLEEAGYIAREKHGRTKKIRLAQKFFDYFDLPPGRVRDAFAGFEAVEKAIEAKEKELGRTLEVYEAKGSTEGKIFDVKKEKTPLEEVPEMIDESSEAKPSNEKTGQAQPESLIAEEDAIPIQEDTLGLGDTGQNDLENPWELIPENSVTQDEDEPAKARQKSGMVDFFRDEQNIKENQGKPIRIPKPDLPSEDLPSDPESMIQRLIEKKADMIMNPPKEEKKNPAEQKDFLSDAYDEIEQDKKDLEKKNR